MGTLSPTVTFAGTMTDVMGYCAGLYFSDYSYDKVQAYAEARAVGMPTASGVSTAPARAAASSAGTTGVAGAAGYLVISGTIDARGVTLNPAHATTILPARIAQSPAAHAVRVLTRSGRTITYPLMLNEIADEPDAGRYFSRTTPNPGAAARIDVLRDGVAIADEPGSGAAMKRIAAVGAPQPPPVRRPHGGNAGACCT